MKISTLRTLRKNKKDGVKTCQVLIDIRGYRSFIGWIAVDLAKLTHSENVLLLRQNPFPTAPIRSFYNPAYGCFSTVISKKNLKEIREIPKEKPRKINTKDPVSDENFENGKNFSYSYREKIN